MFDGKEVVTKLITDLAVFEVYPQTRMVLTEIYDDVTLDQVIASTGCMFQFVHD